MKEVNINQIAEDIKTMINVRVNMLFNSEQTYKEAFEDLCYEIEYATDSAKELMDNYKEEGLTYGSIEAEGAYREIKTLFNRMEQFKERFKEEN